MEYNNGERFETSVCVLLIQSNVFDIAIRPNGIDKVETRLTAAAHSADEAEALAGRAKKPRQYSITFYTTLNHLPINTLNYGLILKEILLVEVGPST